MKPEDVRSRRSRILAMERFKRVWPAAYHDPGQPYRTQKPFFDKALETYADHYFGLAQKKHNVPLVVVFEGATGSGKTHLAAAVSLFGVLKTGAMVEYVGCPTLASDLSGAPGERRLEPGDIQSKIDDADIVTLDDLGTQNGLGKSVVPEIIEACLRSQKLLIVTTNANHDDLMKSIGERCMSRLAAGVWIRMSPDAVPDFRDPNTTRD